MSQILFIDDNALALSALSLMLTRAGHRVVEAANGREAVLLQRGCPAELVVTDNLMPEMDGMELICELRNLSPRPKIIAISGGGFVEPGNVLKVAGELGADATFAKPLDRDEFLETVASLTVISQRQASAHRSVDRRRLSHRRP